LPAGTWYARYTVAENIRVRTSRRLVDW